jgi:hypothetical protein
MEDPAKTEPTMQAGCGIGVLSALRLWCCNAHRFRKHVQAKNAPTSGELWPAPPAPHQEKDPNDQGGVWLPGR